MTDHRSADHPRGFGQIVPPDLPWLAHQVREKILWPDLPIVDAHHHVGASLGMSYLPQDFTADAKSGHRIEATVAVEWHAGHRADGPPALRPVGETEYVVGLTSHGTHVAAGIVGGVDLALGEEVGDVVDAHLAAGAGRFAGVRFVASWDPHAEVRLFPPTARPHMLAEPAIRAGARTVADIGLPLDLWILGPQLLDVAELADAIPHLTIVLNHCGGPLGFGPYADNREKHFTEWAAGIEAIAQRPNVVCKLGGLLGSAAAFDYPAATSPPTSGDLAAAWRPWIRTCIETFGPKRCMFESNFPVEKMGTGYATLWNAFKRLTEDATFADRSALFSVTARRVYSLDN